MPLFSIDTTLCARDQHCIHACPMGLLEADAEGFPRPTEQAEARCVDCGHCVAACPTQALSHARLPQADFLKVQTPMPGPDAVDALIRNRRSIRRYKAKPVPDAELHALMDLMRHAPTASNSRQVRWSVVRNPARTRELAGLAAEWTVGSGYFPQAVQVFEQGGDMVLRNAPHVVFCTAPADYRWAWTDCAIATTTLDLAASARGLGTCWAGLFIFAARLHQPLRAALDLPDGHEVFGGLMLGLPQEHYLRVPPRAGDMVTWLD